jgi:hypothetical protein
MDIKELITYADKIPELGPGGKSIKDYLIKYAGNVSSGHNIIDIGPYMGSTSSYLSIGVIKSGNDVKIHAYDLWVLYHDMNKKAKRFNGFKFNDDYHFDKLYDKNVKPFKKYIKTHKCDCLDIEWQGGRVGLLVDDIGNGKNRTDHIMKTFSPYFITGKTCIFYMDYYYYKEKAKDHPLSLYQRDFMKANKKVFTLIEKPKNSRTAIFRYEGGKINYDVDGDSYNEKTYRQKGK